MPQNVKTSIERNRLVRVENLTMKMGKLGRIRVKRKNIKEISLRLIFGFKWHAFNFVDIVHPLIFHCLKDPIPGFLLWTSE